MTTCLPDGRERSGAVAQQTGVTPRRMAPAGEALARRWSGGGCLDGGLAAMKVGGLDADLA